MTSLYDGLEQVDAPPPGTPSTASAAAPPRAAAPKPGLYDGLEVVQEQSPDVLAAPPRAAQTIGESFQAGVQGSSGGLLWRQKLPDLMAKEHESFWEGLARSAGGLAGDIIPMTAGAVALGGVGATMGSAVAPGAGTLVGGLVGSGAGMGFVPAALRESLIMAFRSGEIRDKADWWNELRKAATRVMAETATSAATMGVIGAAGRVTGRLIAPMIGESLSVPTQVAGKKAAEGLATGVLSSAELAATILAFPTIPALLDLRLPSMAEIGHSAIIIGGLKGAHITAERVADIFAKTGKTPAEQVADAQQDPKLAGEIADVPRGTSVPAKMDKLLADAERLANPEPVLPKNLGELAVPSGEAPRAGAPPIMDLVGKAEQLANVIPEAPRVRDLIQNLKDRGPLATDVTDDLQSMVAAVERLDALPRTELTPAEKTEQTDLRAKVAELESKVRSIPTEAEHDASAKVVYNDVMDQLAALEKSRADAGQTPLYDKPPEAIAKLVQRQVETQARMWGVLPEEIYQERYPSFKNVRERPERSIARAAARAERVLEQDQADLDFTKSGGYGGGREEIRSPAQAEELPATVGGGRPEQGWAGATRIRGAAGPLEVYRGGGQPLAVDHFGPEALGKASGNPSSGLGVWFTNTESEAATYGTVERAFLDMRNPKYIRIEDLPGFDNVADAQAYAEKLRQQGYDGIIVDAQHLGGKTHFVAFHPDTVIPNTPTLFQSSQEKLQSVAGLAAIERHLTPEEKGKLRAHTAERLIEQLQNLPTTAEVAEVAKAGVAKRGWYRESARAILSVFGPDSPRFAALLAATSPQVSVESNLANALNIWKNWLASGRPVEREKILKVMAESVQGTKGADSVLDAWVNNTVRALTSDNLEGLILSGPKVNSFFNNLIGHTYEVTNDAWMANYALVDQAIFGGSLNVRGTDPGKGTGYLAMNVRIRQAAERLTKFTGEEWTPAEVQETVWSWAKALYERASQAGETRSAVELLREGELTNDLIASTPDFRSLFNEERYRGILEQAGYGEKLSELAAGGPGDAGAGNQVAGARGEAGSVAASPLLTRAARRLDELRAQREEDRTLYQTEPEKPLWYSALARQISEAKMNQAPAQGWKDLIRGMKGVKADEIKWSGIEDWLDARKEAGDRVTKEEVNAFLEQNGVKVTETALGGEDSAKQDAIINDLVAKISSRGYEADLQENEHDGGFYLDSIRRRSDGRSWDHEAIMDERAPAAIQDLAMQLEDALTAEDRGVVGGQTKFESYTLPGAKAGSYRELLLTLPPKVTVREELGEPRTMSLEAGAREIGLGAEDLGPVGTQVMIYPHGLYMTKQPDGQYHVVVFNDEYLGRSLRDAENFLVSKMGGEVPSQSATPQFRSSHFNEPNILAHVRFDERTAPADGPYKVTVSERGGGRGNTSSKTFKSKLEAENFAEVKKAGGYTATVENTGVHRVLFIEEIQSDWAQQGKKRGFAEQAYPEIEKSIIDGSRIDDLDDAVRGVQDAAGITTGDGAGMYFSGSKGERWARETPQQREQWLRDWLRDETGFGNNTKVPSAPFVGKTEAWVALTLKRMIRYAAENGFDRVAWTTGAQQAERYTSALRKSVDEIEWKKTKDGVQLVGYKGAGTVHSTAEWQRIRDRIAEIDKETDTILDESPSGQVQELSASRRAHYNAIRLQRRGLAEQLSQIETRTKVVDTTEKETSLSDAIGKAMAEKILSDPNAEGTISGESIMVSDTGMANFYDRIVPNIANDVLKKLGGGKVGEMSLDVGEKGHKGGARYTVGATGGGRFRIVDTSTNEGVGTFMGGAYDSRAEAQREADSMNGSKASPQLGFEVTPQMREKALEGMPLFQRNAEVHRAAYQVNARLISTFETADQSSILHELGHHFLEDMKYFAAKPDAPARVKEMWDTARQEFAIGEGEIPAASHELMARSFERYLGDGEAPTPALAAMFAQFKEWILSVYKDIKNIAGVNISPEVKKLFDRMLATDEEIKAAQELGVPRSYAPEAMANEARKIVPGFKAEQASMEPYADSIPKGPGEAPNDSHINYAYIDSPLRVQLTMQKMAEIDQANIQKQRGGAEGVKSWAESNAQQAKYVNDILGGSPDTLRLLSDRDPEAPGPDVKLGILKKLSVGAAQNAARLRDVILQKGHDATVVDQLQYLGSLETMRVIQAEFLGERAGVARALNALKDASGGDEQAFAKMLASISTGSQELFQSSRTPEQEQALLKAKLDEILARYSGKSTLDIAKLHKEIGTLKGSFKVVKDMEKASTWQMLVEVWKAGLLSGPQTPVTNIVGTSAFQFMRPLVDAIAAGIGTARGARVGMGAEDRISMAEPFARVYSMLAGIQEGLINGYHALKVEGTTGKTEQYREAIPGRLGSVIRFPFRLMSAGDVITTTMYKRGEMKTLAMRQALGEGLGLSSRELNVRVQELMDNPTAQMEFIGDEASTRMAFNAPGGDKMRSLQKFVHDWSLEWMIPFIRTPLNITTELARMSPFAPLAAQWRADIAKGGVARDRAIAEVVLGSGIMSLTMAMAFSGQLTGAGSPDQGKNRGKAGVEQPYSWKIGDTWYEYARIQPMGTLVGMATDLAKIWDHLNDEEKDKIPKMLATAFANAVTNQTFLQGITNFVNASSDPTRFGPRFLQQFSASMVPNIIGQPTAMADPVVREVNGMLDAVKARIPGFRQELLPKRDWLGEAVQTKERMGAVLPVREQKISDDKVRLEAARLDISMAATPKKTHVGKGTGKIGDVEFTPEEQDTFAKVGGKMAHEILGNIVSSPGYDDIPDLVKRRIFSRVLSASHQVAAAAALPPEKRVAYLQSITEKMQAELAPAQEGQ